LFDGSCGACFLHAVKNIQDIINANIDLRNLFMLYYRILAILMMSENTPAAVTPAPAP